MLEKYVVKICSFFFYFSKSLQDQKCQSINIEKLIGKAAKMLYLFHNLNVFQCFLNPQLQDCIQGTLSEWFAAMASSLDSVRPCMTLTTKVKKETMRTYKQAVLSKTIVIFDMLKVSVAWSNQTH